MIRCAIDSGQEGRATRRVPASEGPKMRVRRILAVLGFVLLPVSGVARTDSGDVVALNPLCTEGTSAFTPALVGTWTWNDNGFILELKFRESEPGGKAYTVTVPSEHMRFDVCLVRLGDFLFFDVITIEPQPAPSRHRFRLIQSEKGTNFEPRLVGLDPSYLIELVHGEPTEPDGEVISYELRFHRAHLLFIVQIDAEGLRLAGLDVDRVKKTIEEQSVDVGHETVAHAFVLTDSSDDLQRLVLNYAERWKDDFLDDAWEFHQQK